MSQTPTHHRRSRSTTNLGLGLARRGRFLVQFERWKRKFRSLRDALLQIGMPRRVYYRWRNGQVVPKESALRRYCLHTGIDLQYVLTGIPSKVGHNQTTLWHYQEQHRQAQTATQRLQAYQRLVVETLLVLQEEFPIMTVEMTIRPKPAAILRYVIDELYSFEISIIQLPSGYVGFELYRIDRTVPTHAMESWCDEGSLLGVRRYLRENTRATLKKIKEEDVLTPLLKTEYAHNARYNARF